MAQEIKQGDIFGRVGTGFGKGLAEQLPKEMERGRLSNALKNVGEQKNLTPFQKFSGLVSAAHEYPQVVQTGGELLKQEGIRNSFAKNANRGQGQEPAPGGQQPQQPLPRNIAESFAKIGKQTSPTGASYKAPSEIEGQSTGENPLRPEAQPAKPWTQDRWVNEMADAQERYPDLNNQEIMNLVDKKQQRELAAPAAEQAIDAYRAGVQDEANTAFDKALATKTEKTGEDLLKQVPGTLQNKLKRKMVNELITNKGANIKDVADKWSDVALRRAQALDDTVVDSNKGMISKGASEIVSNLNARSKIFKDAGDSENYRDILINNFGFSPQRASQISHHPSKSAKSWLGSISRTDATPGAMTSGAIKRANELVKHITPSDSVQSIARTIKDKDPYFNEDTFFQELKDIIQDDERNNPFTAMQKEEITQGGADNTPNWADVWYFPLPHGFSRGGKK